MDETASQDGAMTEDRIAAASDLRIAATVDLHERVTGLWEGKWDTFRTCARCANIRRDYFCSWVYGAAVETFKEAFGFDYRDGIPTDFDPCKEVA